MILAERVSRVQGLNPEQFVAYVLLSDALSDLAESEFPDLAGKLADQEEDVVSSLKKMLKEKKLSLKEYLDLGTAEALIKKIDTAWAGKIEFEDFLTFDRDAAVRLILQMSGNDIDVDSEPRVSKFLKANGISIPESEIDMVPVYKGAYRAAEDLLAEDVRVTPAKSLVMETYEGERSRAKQDALRVLMELQRRYYPRDRELERMIGYLEYLR